MNADHPCVVTIDSRSKPRVLFSGTKLVEVDFPVGTRVIYAKPPMEPLPDVGAAIRYAVNHPENSEPLYAKLKPGMQVTIALDDISLPLPQMVTPDIRQQVLEVVLPMLEDHGITDIHLIVATCLHRPMAADEIRRMVGRKIFDEYWPDRLYNHDAEKPGGLTHLGETEEGDVVEINTRAVESDLTIYLNVNFVPMDGGHKSVAVGLCGYNSLRSHHNPHTIRQSVSYMDPEQSELNHRVVRMGRLVNRRMNVFNIETTVNNRMFGAGLDFLQKNEDDLTEGEDRAMKALVRTLNFLPRKARQAIFEKVPAPYGITGVFAGETEAVHKQTLERSYQQYLVPVEGQSDIVVFGVPYISPYNVGAHLNPLLVACMIQGYLYNMFRGQPLLRKGGTVIAFHPCTDEFDPDQHPAYVEFVHRLLPITRDAERLHKEFEEEFRKHPGFIQLYRSGKAYHPAHPFFMWYWGENGRQNIGRVIIVGADNETIPHLLGYETAATFEEALRMAKDTAPTDPDITCLRVCPFLMADVKPTPTRGQIAGEAK